MKYNLNQFEEIKATVGGRKKATFSLSRSLNFRGNKLFIDKYNLKNYEFVKIKSKKEKDKLIIALVFMKEKKEGAFSLSWYNGKEKDNYSFLFTARGIFSKFSLRREEIIKDKSIKFEPEIQEFEGDKYFIIEVPLRE